MDTIEMMEQAMAAYQAGRDEEAAAVCRDVVQREPDNPDAQYVLGLIAYRRQDLDAAEEHLRTAIAFEPEAYWYHAGLAEVLMARGQFEDGSVALAEAAKLKPDSPEIARAAALLMQRFGTAADQIQAWRRVVELSPGNVNAVIQLAQALLTPGTTAEAIRLFRQALEHDTDLIEAQLGLAIALNHERQHAEAAEHAKRAAELRPEDARPHHALALSHLGFKQYDEAIDELRRAIELDPKFKDAHERLTLLLAASGDVGEAMEQWKRLLEVFPHDPAAMSNVLMTLNYLPDLSPQEIYDAHRQWARTYAEPMSEGSRKHSNTNEPHRRLRIGYVSPDFYRHAVSSFTRAIFAAHHQDKYEVVAFSDVVSPDNITLELQQRATKWLPIAGRNDGEVAEIVRFEGIDILIDLTGLTGRHRLGVFARKAAPVQITYLGYCNTTGIPAMDWIVGDDITDPPDDTQPYVEKILRLPGCFCCYTPENNAPEVNELPALGGRPLTIGAFHALRKINDVVLDVWATMLRELPDARLLVWRTYLTPRAEARLRDAFAQRGVAVERIAFRSQIPRGQSHYSVYHEVDLSIDAFPWSGHTTSCNALWMGVPLVTLRGHTHCSRMAASTLTAAGFGQFVANSHEQYVQIVKDLAADLPRLAEMRRTMRATTAASPLCDAEKFIIGWERALRDAWRAWCQSRRITE